MMRRTRQRGSALPLVSILAVVFSALVASSLDALRSTARADRGLVARIEAFHAADSALRWCERHVTDWPDNTVREAALSALSLATPRWHERALFEGAGHIAVQPVHRWRNGSRAPQCLIEMVNARARGTRTYLLTARGFAADEESEIWLQVAMSVGGPQGPVRHGWRAVAGRAF